MKGESVQQRLMRLAETLKAFDMTEAEWERYHREHPGADRRNHHIIPTPRKWHGHEFKSEAEREKYQKREAIKYFKRMKTKHPHYRPMIPKHEFERLLFNGEYSCISAGPNGEEEQRLNERNPEFFRKRTEELRKDLDRLGVEYTEIVGSYKGGEEISFLVSHSLRSSAESIDKSKGVPTLMVGGNEYSGDRERVIRELNKLGEKYNQDSVGHVKKGNMEWHYTTGENKGKRTPGLKITERGPSYDEDGNVEYFSEAKLRPDEYTKWNCKLDFDNLIDNPYI